MIWYYILSLMPLAYLLKRYAVFSLLSAYFIFNWIFVSISVFVASLSEADLVELGTYAQMDFASVIFNLSLTFMLFVAIITYKKFLCVSVRVCASKRNHAVYLERIVFVTISFSTMVIAIFSLLPVPPVALGTPVSEFLATLDPLSKFAFISIAIGALPLSRLARGYFLAGQWNALLTGVVCLLPGMIWILAGEKMGYLLFILFGTSLPWLQFSKRNAWGWWLMLFAIVSCISMLLTYIQYSISHDDPLLQLTTRIAMQGQLWYYFYHDTSTMMSIDTAISFLLGMDGTGTIHAMMAIVMPYKLYLEYDTAAMTGSHLPPLLYAFGWELFPIALVLAGILFGIATTILRLAVQIDYLMMSYLLIASFTFPGIEVWVGGNISRLISIPPTFLVFMLVLMPLLISRITYRSNCRVVSIPKCGNPRVDE